MRFLVTALVLAGAPLWAQQTLPGLQQMAVEVEQDGKRFVCALQAGDGVVVTEPCVPLMTPEQADKMAEAVARIETLSGTLSTAEAATATQTARADGAEASASEATARAEALALELAGVQAELTAAQEALSGLDDLKYMAGLRALVIALETNSVDVGLAAVGDALPLARASMDFIAETYGDGCVIPREAFREHESEIGLEIYRRALETLNVPADVAPLIMATHPQIDTYDAEAMRFEAALDEAAQGGDADTHEKGMAAIKIAERAIKKLDDAMSEAARSPLVTKMSDDNQSILLTKPDCAG